MPRKAPIVCDVVARGAAVHKSLFPFAGTRSFSPHCRRAAPAKPWWRESDERVAGVCQAPVPLGSLKFKESRASARVNTCLCAIHLIANAVRMAAAARHGCGWAVGRAKQTRGLYPGPWCDTRAEPWPARAAGATSDEHAGVGEHDGAIQIETHAFCVPAQAPQPCAVSGNAPDAWADLGQAFGATRAHLCDPGCLPQGPWDSPISGFPR